MSDDPAPSVTRWTLELRDGDQKAARHLWEFLRGRLLGLAKNNVRSTPVYDEEDIALSAFGSLCSGLLQGSYRVNDRNDLWQLLAVITVNKARTRARDDDRVKRGGRANRIDNSESILKELICPCPPADLSLAMQEECERLLQILEQRELKMVAMLKVEGYTNDEIACQMGCSRRAVQRRLNCIRDFWSAELNAAQPGSCDTNGR